MKNKSLWIVFAALLGIYLLSQVFSGGKKTRSFEPILFPIDTTAVTSIEIYAQADSFELVKLERNATGWTASKGSISTPVDNNRINALLGQVLEAKAQRIAAKKKEKWPTFELDETAAKAHVKVQEGSKTIADFWVGGFRFNQQTRSGTSFVRKSEADDVYALNGFFSMSFGQGFDSYRNKTLVKVNKDDLTKITLQQEQQSIVYSNTAGQWSSDGGVALDSTKMQAYLSGLANFNGQTIVDGFSETQANILSRQSITFAGNNMSEPVRVDCFELNGSSASFICRSSLNPNTYFSGDSTTLYTPIFKTPAELQ